MTPQTPCWSAPDKPCRCSRAHGRLNTEDRGGLPQGKDAVTAQVECQQHRFPQRTADHGKKRDGPPVAAQRRHLWGARAEEGSWLRSVMANHAIQVEIQLVQRSLREHVPPTGPPNPCVAGPLEFVTVIGRHSEDRLGILSFSDWWPQRLLLPRRQRYSLVRNEAGQRPSGRDRSQWRSRADSASAPRCAALGSCHGSCQTSPCLPLLALLRGSSNFSRSSTANRSSEKACW